MKTFLLILVTAAVTVGILFGSGALSFGPRGAVVEEATPVRLELATVGSLSEAVSAPGEIQPRTKVLISARVSARIRALPVAEGEEVRGGTGPADTTATLLVRLDSTELEAALLSAEARHLAQVATIQAESSRIASQEADLEAAEIQRAQARRDLDRQLDQLAKKQVSQAVVDEAQSLYDERVARIVSQKHALSAARKNLEVLHHNLDAALADISTARENLSYSLIRSPIDGVVTKRHTNVGELTVTGTMNNAGTVILEVSDLSQMLLIAEVDEADIGRVAVGLPARVRIQAYPDRIFPGTVSAVALTATTDPSKFFRVEILLDTGGERIFSGLTADVDIEVERHDNVVVVPSQAIVGRRLEDLPAEVRLDNPLVDESRSVLPVVFRYQGQKAVATPVELGPSDATHSVIRAGVTAGDSLIVWPYRVLETLAHDDRVVDERDGGDD